MGEPEASQSDHTLDSVLPARRAARGVSGCARYVRAGAGVRSRPEWAEDGEPVDQVAADPALNPMS